MRAGTPETPEVARERQPRQYAEAVAMSLAIPRQLTLVTSSNSVEEMRQRLEEQQFKEFRLLRDFKASVERDSYSKKKQASGG